MSLVKCPSCGKKHEVNVGSLMAMIQIAELSEEQRKERGRKLTEAKRRKKLSTG